METVTSSFSIEEEKIRIQERAQHHTDLGDMLSDDEFVSSQTLSRMGKTGIIKSFHDNRRGSKVVVYSYQEVYGDGKRYYSDLVIVVADIKETAEGISRKIEKFFTSRGYEFVNQV